MSNDELVLRVQLLELRVSKLKRLLLLCVLAPASVFILSQAPRATSLVADEFVLRDVDNRPRARLYMAPGGPVLEMADSRGNTRVALVVEDDAVDLGFFASNKALRLNLDATETSARIDALSNQAGTRSYLGTDGGRPVVAVAGSDGHRAVIMQVKGQAPEIRIQDEEENVRAELTHGAAGPMLRLLDANEQPRVLLTNAALGSGLLLKGPNGEGRALLSVDAQSKPSLHMNDGSGRIVFSQP